MWLKTKTWFFKKGCNSRSLTSSRYIHVTLVNSHFTSPSFPAWQKRGWWFIWVQTLGDSWGVTEELIPRYVYTVDIFIPLYLQEMVGFMLDLCWWQPHVFHIVCWIWKRPEKKSTVPTGHRENRDLMHVSSEDLFGDPLHVRGDGGMTWDGEKLRMVQLVLFFDGIYICLYMFIYVYICLHMFLFMIYNVSIGLYK
jgi:hypothetical protein